MAGAVFSVFSDRHTPAHTLTCKQTLAFFFPRISWSCTHFYKKHVYELNFATFSAISTWNFPPHASDWKKYVKNEISILWNQTWTTIQIFQSAFCSILFMSIIKFPIFSLVFCHGSYFVAIGTSFCSNNAVHRPFRATRLHNSTLFFGLRGGCFCADLTFVLRFLHVAWGMHVEQEGAHIACQERWHVVQFSLSMYSRLCILVVTFGQGLSRLCRAFTQDAKWKGCSSQQRSSNLKIQEGMRHKKAYAIRSRHRDLVRAKGEFVVATRGHPSTEVVLLTSRMLVHSRDQAWLTKAWLMADLDRSSPFDVTVFESILFI